MIRGLQLGPEDPILAWPADLGLRIGALYRDDPFDRCVRRRFPPPGLPVNAAVANSRTGSFGMATMPQWWPEGYYSLLALPGIGYFRVPAGTPADEPGPGAPCRRGFDGASAKTRFRLGVAASCIRRLCGDGRLVLDNAARRPCRPATRRDAGRVSLGCSCVVRRAAVVIGCWRSVARRLGSDARRRGRAGDIVFCRYNPMGLVNRAPSKASS